MGNQVLPLYAVCDESYSMADHLVMVNAALRSFHRVARADPLVAGLIRFSLIGFAESARVIVPLTRLGDSTPEIDPCGEAATSFGAAFTVLRRAIERDFVMLTGVGYHVLRPCALFVSDGQPTDPATWPDDYAAVVDRNWPARPDMLAFGVGDADLATIARIGTVSPNPAGLAGLYEFVRERAISTFTTSRLENARPATDRLEKGATGLDLERSWIRVRE